MKNINLFIKVIKNIWPSIKLFIKTIAPIL